jgi:predicted aspartyl protease
MFQDAKVSLLGREATFECLELARGTTPLLGVFPLELLGIEPDVRNQRLRVLPENADESYLTIL